MPNPEVKTRFTLEGEQKFRTAMNEAAAAVKVLNSEQKLATATFKNTGDAQKYAADKTQILKDKIEAQKAAVKAAEAAVKQLTNEGYDKNSKKMQTWQQRLNSAQTELVKMQTELQNVASDVEKTTTKTDKMNDSLETIGKKASFDAVVTGLSKITGAMEAAASKALELAGNLKNAMVDAAGWADDLATTASVYGFDTDTLQQMQYTADILDTTTENIIKSRQKLINNMVYGGTEVQDAFDALGVSTRDMVSGKYGDVVGEYRDWADVFWEVGEALMNLDDFEQANALATKTLGRSWEQLKPIFDSDWASEDNYLGRAFSSAREYYDAVMKSWNTVSDEDVGKLTALDDALQKLENEFTTLKETVLAQLAPGLEGIANAVSTLLSQLNEYLKTDEGKEKLQGLSDAVSALFASLSDIDFGAAINIAAGAIDSLTSGLLWLKDNWGEVQIGLLAIAGAFGLMKVSEGVLSFLSMIGGAKYLFGGSGGGGNAASDAATTAAAAGSASVGKLNIVKRLAANAGTTLANLDPAGTTALILPYLEDHTEFGRQLRNGGTLQEAAQAQISNITDFVSSIPERLTSWYHESYWDEIVGGIGDWFGSLGPAWDDYFQLKGENERAYSNTLQDALTEMQAFFEGNPVEAETQPVVEDNAAADIAAQVGTVEIPAILMVTSDKSGPYTKLGSFSAGSPLVYYSKDLNEHANGLSYVPFDNYPAILHKGERVQTAREVSSANSFNSNLYVEKMIMNNSTDANGLASAMAAAQRRRMSGYGS